MSRNRNKRKSTPNKVGDLNDRVMVVDLNTYVAPEVTEVAGKEWVKYGDDNDFFEYLLDRYYGSTTNNAIINGVSDMVAGNGITSKFAHKRPDEYAKAVTLFRHTDIKMWAFDLKCLGYYIMMITRAKDGSVLSVEHTPVQNWRSGIADEDTGEIEVYFHSDDWAKCTNKEYEPTAYPVYSSKKKDAVSVLPVKPYRSGSFYYPYVDYMGCLQYAHLEEEISNYHLNNILNGLSPSMVINFNNGDPGQQERRRLKREITNVAQGTSNSGRWFLSFNDDKERAITVETLAVTDADKQYEFLSTESMAKIIVGHRVTSPLLFGIRDTGGGFGSNAEEIIEGYNLFSKMVLMPQQKLIISSMEGLLRDEGINLPLSIKPLEPVEDEKAQEEQLKSAIEPMAELLASGEDVDESVWELLDERDVNYDLEDWFDTLVHHTELASVPSSSPNKESNQDTSLFKVRYTYAPSKVSPDSREFCEKMVRAGKVYRKEDIESAGKKAVNKGWGPNGASTYSIWLYKGGGNCHHFWQRKTYLRKDNKKISVNEARRLITRLPLDERDDARMDVNDPLVAKLPVDMPNNGFLPKN